MKKVTTKSTETQEIVAPKLGTLASVKHELNSVSVLDNSLVENFKKAVEGVSLGGLKMATSFKGLYKIEDTQNMADTLKSFITILKASDKATNTRQFKNYTAFLNAGLKSVSNFQMLVTDENFLNLDMQKMVQCSAILSHASKEGVTPLLGRITDEGKILNLGDYHASTAENSEAEQITLDGVVVDNVEPEISVKGSDEEQLSDLEIRVADKLARISLMFATEKMEKMLDKIIKEA